MQEGMQQGKQDAAGRAQVADAQGTTVPSSAPTTTDGPLDDTSGRYGDNAEIAYIRGKIETALAGKSAIARAGGAMDRTMDGPMISMLPYFKPLHPRADVQYFDHADAQGIRDAIARAGGAANVALVGHSYGGDTAAQVVADGAQVGALVTLDPVSHNPPSFQAVRANAGGVWINVNANPDRSRRAAESNMGNFVAGMGGAWDEDPRGSADQYYNANVNHAEIHELMGV